MSVVLDASAILAFLREEPGSGVVEDSMADGSMCGAANWSEVAQKVQAAGSADRPDLERNPGVSLSGGGRFGEFGAVGPVHMPGAVAVAVGAIALRLEPVMATAGRATVVGRRQPATSMLMGVIDLVT